MEVVLYLGAAISGSVPRLARSMCVPFWYRRFLLEVVRE
jgi:hypothetical protein